MSKVAILYYTVPILRPSVEMLREYERVLRDTLEYAGYEGEELQAEFLTNPHRRDRIESLTELNRGCLRGRDSAS